MITEVQMKMINDEMRAAWVHHLLPVLLILLSSFGMAQGQEIEVRGKVVDEQNQPLIGVTVTQKGAGKGTTTNADGLYRLNVSSDARLTFTFVGFHTVEEKVNGRSVIDVVLREDNQLLGEVVVIGYGTQKKVNLTGAVSTISSNDLEDRLSHSVANMLQGAVPGLNVTTSKGKPGSSGALNIRGVNSINSADPLVVIDGITGTAADLARLNPSDIKTISIIKDASAAAIYGARAAFGVVLVSTKSGSDSQKTSVRYSGRFGWDEPTTSTDFDSRGYYSVLHVNTFWQADNGKNYIRYTDKDMEELWARVNDTTEQPGRPWVVEEIRDGKKQWVYYGNNDWWHLLFRDKRPVQQHNVSISGGTEAVSYFISGNYNRQEGMQRTYPDIFDRYTLRSKVGIKINKWLDLENNTSFYKSSYSSIGDGDIEDLIAYSARHALAVYPLKNPDGSWLYGTPYQSYKVGNGRHIMLNENTHRLLEKGLNLTSTTRLVFHPIEPLSVTADFTYRFNQSQKKARSSEMWFRQRPGDKLESYNTGAGQNNLTETISNSDFYATNVFVNYDQKFNEVHSISAVVGMNSEYYYRKNISAWGNDLTSIDLDDLDLVGMNEDGITETGVGGGQVDYALLGFFGRINYSYMDRYLIEISSRYDGTSRFKEGQRWGFFPSASVGWRISEEPFFRPLKSWVDNLKLRLSFGSLGNQSVSSYYPYLRLVKMGTLGEYTFGEGGLKAKYSKLTDPLAPDLTWETVQQWNLGFNLAMLNNRLNIDADIYLRNTLNMLTEGVALPSVYGAKSPETNAADMQTKGYEISIDWRDQLVLADKPFRYSLGFSLSDYRSYITKYDNPNKTFAKKYYEGMRLGEIWGFVTDGLFKTDEEAKQYAKEVDLSYRSGRLTGGWLAGDVKFVDLDGDGQWGIGQNTVDHPGDRKILGNSLPFLSYGISSSFNWSGIDVSLFFQGTGNHYWYPHGQTMSYWGGFGYPYLSYLPKGFMDKVWTEENPDSYFPRPRAYGATGGYLAVVNDRYLLNARYLRLKNLTIGYSLPHKLLEKVGIESLRLYASGENIYYWSPLKKVTQYIDPEAAFNRSSAVNNNAYYPWPKTYMIGIDIKF